MRAKQSKEMNMSKGTKTVVAKAAKKCAKPAAEKKATAKAAPKAEKAVKAAKPAAAKKAAPKAAAKKAPAKTATKAAAPKAEKAVKAPAAKKAAAKSPKKVTVVFEANCPLATTVSVAGSFNNWAVDKDMLKKDKKTGLWTAKISLAAGDYEYKFVCDGKNWDAGDNKIKHV